MSPSPLIDLHTHSNRSDGALSPRALVERAVAAGVGILALTDHDSIDGLDEARITARQHGLRLVDGVEISATWRAQEIHVLGLWIDPGGDALRMRLNSQLELRHRRMHSMCDRLTKSGLPGAALLAQVQSAAGVPTRTHLATALVDGGFAVTTQDAFRRYLARGKLGYRSVAWPSVEAVVGWIRAAGGKACLAHPLRYTLSAGARRTLVADFAKAGGAGLEIVTGNNAPQRIDAAAQMALQFKLAGSVGSDFHDPRLIWNPLGRLAKLPDRVTPLWQEELM